MGAEDGGRARVADIGGLTQSHGTDTLLSRKWDKKRVNFSRIFLERWLSGGGGGGWPPGSAVSVREKGGWDQK